MARLHSLIAVASLAMLAACASSTDDDATEGDEAAITGAPQADIGQFFMIEHYGVVPGGYGDVQTMIKQKHLGAIILWNPDNQPGTVVRQMAKAYANSAHAGGTNELFVAADQEEKGVQRFKSRHGFTDLVQGSELGDIVARTGDAKVCDLHARITAREMASSGMNMTLGTVSDAYTHDSGTPGMFRTRAISSDAQVIAKCISAMAKAYAEERHVVFITKHFPGLGNASGNTDVDPSVHTYSDHPDEMERELAPYRATTAELDDSSFPMFGTMISHANYPILDKSKTPATLSHQILSTFLRAPATEDVSGGVDAAGQPQTFKGMGLRGVTVSDAFWTWGLTQHIDGAGKRRLMAQSFLAGMDMLMISKTDFNAAWDYFQQIYAGQVPAAEQAALLQATGDSDFPTLQARFKARVVESATRIKAAKDAVGSINTFAGTGDPDANTGDLANQYRHLTQ